MYRVKNNTYSFLYINGFRIEKGETSPLYKKNQTLTCQTENDTIIIKLEENSISSKGNGKLFAENDDGIICVSEK